MTSIRTSPLVAWTAAVLLGLALVPALQRPPAHAEPAPERLTSRPRPAVAEVKHLAVGDAIRTEANQRRRVALPDGSVLYVNQRSMVKLIADRMLTLAAGELFVEAAPVKAKDEVTFVVRAPKREFVGTTGKFAVRADETGSGIVVVQGEVKVGGVEAAVTAGQQLPAGGEKAVPAPRSSHVLDWTRDLMAAAESPLVPGSQHTGGALIAIDPDGQEAKLSLRKYHVDVHVEDGFARTTIDQTYFNHDTRRLEGTFYFPLPPDASLSRLAMYVDGKLMEGGMVERDYGRTVYESIVYRQKDPALLEWVDGSIFKMRVFPLEGRQEKRILLSYTQRLSSLYGQLTYRFPAGHSLDVVSDWSFHARVKNGAKTPWSSPSHSLKAAADGADLLLDTAEKNVKLDRDVVLSLTEAAGTEGEVARFSSVQHDGATYLMLRYRPNLPGRQWRQRRDWVFLFESSGDRDPLLARVQIDIIRSLLSHAEPDDTFAVLAAGTRVRAFAKESVPVTPDNVRAAVEFLEKSHLIGALDLRKALSEAEPFLKAGRYCEPCLVHVGSGIAALGERRTDVLVPRIALGARYEDAPSDPKTQASRKRKVADPVRYVGIGVGRRWARDFMKTAAEKTGGYFTQINPDEPISWRTFDLLATLNTPRLLNVQLAADDGRSRFLPFTTLVAQGEELCAVARLDPKDDTLPKTITVFGTLNGEDFVRNLRPPKMEVAKDAGYLPRTWAKLEIDRLLAEDVRKHKNTIIELSKAMYVVTPFTSLLVLENEDMYEQYKVDRGRKDHWAMYPAPVKFPVVYEPLPGQEADLAKGARPTAKQVAETIPLRTPPSLIRWPDQSPREVNQAAFQTGQRGIITTGDFPPRTVWGGMPSGGAPGPVLRRIVYDSTDSTGLYQDKVTAELKPMPDSLIAAAEFPPRQRVGTNVAILRQPERERAGEKPFLEGLNSAEDPGPLHLAEESESSWQLGFRIEVKDQLERIRALQELHTRRAMRRQESIAMFRKMSSQRMTLAQAQQVSSTGGEYLSYLLLYRRPRYEQDEHFFSDLVSFAPGMNSSWADVRAVLEAEAAANPRTRPGHIDAAARELIDKTRAVGWQSLTLPTEAGRPAVTLVFDGSGRHGYERTLPTGLREQVVCDGKTLWHLYPELGIGARRSVSRFHRDDFARLVPWFVPPAEDLACGADVKLIGERTVAVVPHGADAAKDKDGKPVPYRRLHLVFDAGNRLAERQVVEMPGQKVLYRESCGADGVVKLLDGDGKELSVLKGELRAAKEPVLTPDTKKLVVLPLPYRTLEHVRKELKVEKKRVEELRFEEGLALFAAAFGEQNKNEAWNLFRRCFRDRDQKQLGFYVLLAACGHNLDSQNVDVLAEHLNEPLAQYLALYSSPVLRKHASQWAVGTGQWSDGFLHKLAVSHALFQRWRADKAPGATEAAQKAERERAIDYVRRNKGTLFGWALLGLMQDRAGDDAKFHSVLAELFPLFEDVHSLSYAARYEHARSLWKAGQREEAQRCFRLLYEKTFNDNLLPVIDADFRRALLSDGKEKDLWGELLRQTAALLIERKLRPAVLTLAWQCWQLDDALMANHLLGIALDGIKDDKERLALTLAGIDFLMETGQLAQADQMLRKLLDDPKLAGRASLWRLAMQLAERRNQSARVLECLEKALDAEYRDLPEVIHLETVRREYGKLLGHYQDLADAMVTLKVAPPSDFLAKVVRTADRWRALEREGDHCQTAARILQVLGDRELGWDYLTTPVGLRVNEAEPWLRLAREQSRQGELELADRAFAAAFEAEPTNAQLLWDRAMNLRQAGRTTEAQKLFRQIAEGKWQPRFDWIKNEARRYVDGR